MSAMHRSAFIIYDDADKPVEVRIDPDHGTVWLSLNQLAEVFGRDKSVISRHLKNIFNTKESDHNSVVAKIATIAVDGKTYQVEYFNLDTGKALINTPTGKQFQSKIIQSGCALHPECVQKKNLRRKSP